MQTSRRSLRFNWEGKMVSGQGRWRMSVASVRFARAIWGFDLGGFLREGLEDHIVKFKGIWRGLIGRGWKKAERYPITSFVAGDSVRVLLLPPSILVFLLSAGFDHERMKLALESMVGGAAM